MIFQDVVQCVRSKWGAWQMEDRYLQLSPTTYIHVLHDPTVVNVAYIKKKMRPSGMENVDSDTPQADRIQIPVSAKRHSHQNWLSL